MSSYLPQMLSLLPPPVSLPGTLNGTPPTPQRAAPPAMAGTPPPAPAAFLAQRQSTPQLPPPIAGLPTLDQLRSPGFAVTQSGGASTGGLAAAPGLPVLPPVIPPPQVATVGAPGAVGDSGPHGQIPLNQQIRFVDQNSPRVVGGSDPTIIGAGHVMHQGNVGGFAGSDNPSIGQVRAMTPLLLKPQEVALDKKKKAENDLYDIAVARRDRALSGKQLTPEAEAAESQFETSLKYLVNGPILGGVPMKDSAGNIIR